MFYIALVTGIALFPPLWAVLALYINVSAGAFALICAGLFVANGNNKNDAIKILIGFLLGDFWAWLALWAMDTMTLNEDVELFVTLFVLGGLAVMILPLLSKWIFCPSWLCGWPLVLRSWRLWGILILEIFLYRLVCLCLWAYGM